VDHHTEAFVGIDTPKSRNAIAIAEDERGAIVLRQKWSRGQVEARLANMPPCLIGMEACVGAHHLSRKGHDARLIPTRYVRPYSKGQKNDFRDSEAIAEAVAGGLHDLGSAATVGRQKDAPCPPNVLLRTIAVGDHSFELATVRSAQLDVRSLLHPSDSHTPVLRAANRSVGFGPLVSQAISKCIPVSKCQP
jgi:hypothetical protein